MNNVTGCKSGNPNISNVEVGRYIGCNNLTAHSFDIYAQTGYEEFYDLAIKAANYYLTEHPENRAKFDNDLNQSIQQTSPPLEK